MGNPRGRPPLDPNDRSVPVKVTYPEKQLAALSSKAREDRCSVNDLIRKMTRLPDQQKLGT